RLNCFADLCAIARRLRVEFIPKFIGIDAYEFLENFARIIGRAIVKDIYLVIIRHLAQGLQGAHDHDANRASIIVAGKENGDGGFGHQEVLPQRAQRWSADEKRINGYEMCHFEPLILRGKLCEEIWASLTRFRRRTASQLRFEMTVPHILRVLSHVVTLN